MLSAWQHLAAPPTAPRPPVGQPHSSTGHLANVIIAPHQQGTRSNYFLSKYLPMGAYFHGHHPESKEEVVEASIEKLSRVGQGGAGRGGEGVGWAGRG